MRRNGTTGLAAPLIALLLSSCGALDGSTAGHTSKADGPTAGQSAEQPTSVRTTAAPEQPEPPQEDEPIATKEINAGDATLRIDITALGRQGELSTLSWDITVEEFRGEYYWRPSRSMGGRWGVGDYTVSNVTLIDPVDSKRYRVAYPPETMGNVSAQGQAGWSWKRETRRLSRPLSRPRHPTCRRSACSSATWVS